MKEDSPSRREQNGMRLLIAFSGVKDVVEPGVIRN